MDRNRQFLLAARPQGDVRATDFRLVETPLAAPAEGEVQVALEYLALEPAMRGWMENRADYIAPLALGDVMRGTGAGRVVASRDPAWEIGTAVSGMTGWQEIATGTAAGLGLRRLPADVPLPAALGLLGITGMTAYFGLFEIGQPKRGDTVLVSGAAGATGSVVGQLARLHGCRVIGIAGSAEKCAWLTGELGFDAAIDYRTQDVRSEVRRLCPRGIDIYFDNVGGEILDIALACLAQKARVVVCGGISRYNLSGEIAGPKNYFNLVFRRARMEGFIVLDYADRFGEGAAALLGHLERGELQHRETIIDGFENMPAALLALFAGENTGKLLVRVR